MGLHICCGPIGLVEMDFLLTVFGYAFVVGGPILLIWLADNTGVSFGLLALGDLAWLLGSTTFLTWRHSHSPT